MRDHGDRNILDRQEATDRLEDLELGQECDLRRLRAGEGGSLGPVGEVRREQASQFGRRDRLGQCRVNQPRANRCRGHGNLEGEYQHALNANKWAFSISHNGKKAK
jgi:hypothetical protein